MGARTKKEEVTMEAKMIDVITNDTIKFFRLDEQDLFYLKIDFATSYLQERFGSDRHIVAALLKHPAFWMWWNELWAERDRNIITRSRFRPHGVIYTYPIGKYVELPNGDGYQPSETDIIPFADVWTFYERAHSWKRIQLYPNYQLIHTCMGEKSD